MHKILEVLDKHPPVYCTKAVVDYSRAERLRITFDVFSSKAAKEILVLLANDTQEENALS